MSILPDRDVPGPYISVDGPHGDVLTPSVASRLAAAVRPTKPSWRSKPTPTDDGCDE